MKENLDYEPASIDDFSNLSPEIQAQISDAGQELAAQGVQSSPVNETDRPQSIESLPDDIQQQIADAGQALSAQDVWASGSVSPEQGAATDWNSSWKSDLPEPAFIQPNTADAMSMER